MSDNRPRITRRRFLAVAGATALAGCSALPNLGESSPPEIDGARLSEIAAGDRPSIPQTVPVDISNGHVQNHIDRTQTLLSQAPLPFDQQEIPNGAMRQEMNETAEEAQSTVERGRNAASPFEAISTLRDARGKGRSVATAWAYANDGLRREGLSDDATTLADDIASFSDRWSYIGDDPIRALVVHGTIESLVRTASNNVEGQPDNPRLARVPENLITVSDYAGALERGRTALTDATYLYDGLRVDVSETGDLTEVFRSAFGDLFDTLEEGTADLSDDGPVLQDVDADIENSPVQRPLQLLHSDLQRVVSITDHRDQGERASAVLSVHRELTRLRAFEDLRERAEGGETYAIESAEDVAELRESAVTAIETALQETEHPDLSRRTLHNMAGLVKHVDNDIGSYDAEDQVSVDWIRREVSEYIYAAAVARVTPEVSSVVASALGK